MSGPFAAPPPAPSISARGPQGVVLIVASVLFAIAVLVLVVGTALFPRYGIASEKMRPTLAVSSTVWAARADGSTVARGDLIIFRRADAASTLVSRVVAIGGDTVESRDCRLIVNDTPVDEPYVEAGNCTERVTRTTVPAGSVYELGDNRRNSNDSRYSGPVPGDQVIGRVVLTSGPSTAMLVAAVAVTGLAFMVSLAAWRGRRLG